ncbi:E3 UBIQUITIN-PROTEIN LIGASE PRAJA [Salix purpurea]|uniref:RING-type E3 ubiquitin transferase n=1 Tax=Salix purpurea TaxID=77065 RepID=A0A9Q0Q218_SALPP|nr:E3 UBIQUITIN-PROTEIN LIGASE PRAJA [Salix purpurea]
MDTQNYNVFVSAIYSSIPGNRSASSSATSPTFSVKLQAVTSYVSDVNVNTPMKPNLLESLAKSRSPVPKTMSDRSPQKSIQWKGNPREDWTRLQSQDDLLRRILDLITHSHDDDEFTLVLIIDKKTILAHHVHERMYYARSAQRAARDATRMVSFMNQQEASLGRPFLPSTWQNTVHQPLRERGEKHGFSSYESLVDLAFRQYAEQEGCKLIPATQSSIQSLEEVIFDGTEPATFCTICLETMAIVSPVTCMPCSHRHKFHSSCIVLWLEISHVCPLCRFELPTE